MNSSLISIIVPVYKAEKYLNKCVSSAVSQTHKNIEIILVDDGSPDKCPEICDEWAKKDSRIKVIHKENGGEISARLAGIEEAAGEYVCFIDSDDWASKDMCEYLLAILNESRADISSVSFVTVNEGSPACENDLPERLESFDFDGMIKNFQDGTMWSQCGKLYKKSLFKNIPKNLPEGLVMSGDMMFNYFIYRNALKMVCSSKQKYFYFRHLDSAIAGVITHRMINDARTAYRVVDENFDKTSSVYPYQIANSIKNDFFLLNSIIRNNKCRDKYDMLRNEILAGKKLIFNSNYSNAFSARQKSGVLLLALSPKLYDASILIRRKIRGY